MVSDMYPEQVIGFEFSSKIFKLLLFVNIPRMQYPREYGTSPRSVFIYVFVFSDSLQPKANNATNIKVAVDLYPFITKKLH